MEEEDEMGNTVELEVIMIRIVDSETMDVTLNDDKELDVVTVLITTMIIE